MGTEQMINIVCLIIMFGIFVYAVYRELSNDKRSV